MSISCAWLALAADWQDSPMFEPLPEHGVSEPSTMGERLAWVSLLCHVKVKGRGGKASFRKNAFARDYKLSERAVAGMMTRAQKCGAAEFEGEIVTLWNWRSYQDKAYKAKVLDLPESGKSRKNSTTHHPSPSTKHQAPQTNAAKPRARTPRDDLFDVVVAEFSIDVRAKANAARVGNAVTELTNLEATPDELRARIARYRKRWPDVSCTPSAIIAHWGEFAADKPAHNGRSAGDHRVQAASDAATQRRHERSAGEYQPTRPTTLKVQRADGTLERVAVGGEGAERPGGAGDARP